MNAQTVRWTGEDNLLWEACFTIKDSTPCIQSLSYLRGNSVNVLATDLIPQFQVTTGIRKPAKLKKSAILSEEEFYLNRWNTYEDSPLSRKEEVESAWASFQTTTMEIHRDQNVTTITFDGLSMGYFSGQVVFSIYEGSNLIQMEAAVSTEHPSLAYIYHAGLNGFHYGRLLYRTLRRDVTTAYPRFPINETDKPEPYVEVMARGRTLAMDQENGAIAVFPPPHKFFFARQLEAPQPVNCYVRNHSDRIMLGIRQASTHGYILVDPSRQDNERWPCYNAPPGTVQRMAMFLCVTAENSEICRDMAMRYTNHDVFRPLSGYKRMLAHFHLEYNIRFAENPDEPRPWISLFREMGCDAAYLCEFWVEGTKWDNKDIRKKEQKRLFEACQRHSDLDFVIIPGEEIGNMHNPVEHRVLPSHWCIMFPKYVYYSRNRDKDQNLVEETEDGPYYHFDTPQELMEVLELENGIVFCPHPETKANEGYPKAYMDQPWYNNPRFYGIGFRYLPADNSTLRLIDGRVSRVWDAINNASAHPKYIMGEMDTYQKILDCDPYGDMNVTYVQTGNAKVLPDDWTPIMDGLRAGKSFVSTGEVLIEYSQISDGEAEAEVSWTFPLRFAEIVYSDGHEVCTDKVSMTDTKPFGKKKIHFSFPKGMKWARIAAWDVAGNGAFNQPVFLAVQNEGY